MLVYFSNRWSSTLASEVNRKTEELKKSQEKLVHSERLGGRRVHGQSCVP